MHDQGQPQSGHQNGDLHWYVRFYLEAVGGAWAVE